MTIRELLLRDFGIDFPISGGTGNSLENAIIIHRVSPNNYVGTEHGILRCLGIGRRIAWKMTNQELLRPAGKTYDKITIDTLSETAGEPIRTTENYYFDITECFGNRNENPAKSAEK